MPHGRTPGQTPGLTHETPRTQAKKVETGSKAHSDRAGGIPGDRPDGRSAGGGGGGRNRTVLISGASVAGPALAYWLCRHGYRPTVVEVAPALRGGGFAVDFRGAAHLTVLERMGILDEIRRHSTGGGTAMSFIDDRGRQLAVLPPEFAGGDLEILRSDLSRILYRHSLTPAADGHPAPEYLFDDTLTSLTPTPDGVHATFARTPSRTFDLVIGADGLHSTVRRLAFGPESEFVSHLGYYVAAWDLPESAGDLAAEPVGYSEPGRTATVGRTPRRSAEPGYTGEAFCVFASAEELTHDRRALPAQKEAIARAYEGAGWRTPELIDTLRAADELYFDSISRVDVPCWSTGRTALLGDAAHGATLGGMGTGSAIIGAYVLAAELAASPDDHSAAFTRYERRLRPYVTQCQEGGRGTGAFLAPATQEAIDARNAALNDPATRAAMLQQGHDLSTAITLDAQTPDTPPLHAPGTA
ncbi:FAD-dependent monooxygenase [Streptomyces endophytica]|uniref:FAD-dependent monooxygenase n=1 Tax=Streptomyces endophytica TaxID=2991496 RepID=A0ABY6PCQ2_9ACTN|nr:FAD-dependent monooxygenase [Streptomyces endophytica]UZJ31337.1 FAD-dependent monooxygenase [Streptomyces endophytica]